MLLHEDEVNDRRPRIPRMPFEGFELLARICCAGIESPTLARREVSPGKSGWRREPACKSDRVEVCSDLKEMWDLSPRPKSPIPTLNDMVYGSDSERVDTRAAFKLPHRLPEGSVIFKT